ncbi:MAG: SMI1/KNR4 family protein [Acidobacteriota bacterium]
MSEPQFPALLSALHQLEFEYADGDGYDFEPYQDFLSADETRDWLRAWTGNPEVTGEEYLVFGQDGSGGHAAIWRARSGAPLEEQPIVFLGSEGEVGVLATDLADYVRLLGAGVGPCEAVQGLGPVIDGAAQPFRAFAAANVPASERGWEQILEAARNEFPDFTSHVESTCR